MACAKFRFIFFMLPIFMFATLLKAANPQRDELKSDDAKRLVGLIDYIRGDYPVAIDKGVVINPSEYAELVEFSQNAQKLFEHWQNDFAPTEQKKIKTNIASLVSAVADKSDYAQVLHMSSELKRDIIKMFSIPVYPEERPNLTLGHKVYTAQCASCHAMNGRADTEMARSLNPPPRNFHDDHMLVSSPFKFFNTLDTGIAGTSMRSFEDSLSEQEKWSVSFLSFAFQFDKENTLDADIQTLSADEQKMEEAILKLGVSVELLASLTDAEWEEWLKAHIPEYEVVNGRAWMEYLRVKAPFRKSIPLRNQQDPLSTYSESFHTKVAFVVDKVNQAKEAFDRGDEHLAQGLLLDGYLNGFDKLERVLLVIDDAFVRRVEREFVKARAFASHREKAQEFHAALSELQVSLGQVEPMLEAREHQGRSFWGGEFLSSFVIILREGFEAFLVVAALLALIKNLGSAQARRWIHAGWIAAIIAGFFTYFLFEKILEISGGTREMVEAVCTGLAVVVLFYTGFWLLSQTERKKWDQYLKQKTLSALNSQRLWGLFSLSFIAVYREAAETVLFYAALFTTAQSPSAVGFGFGFGSLFLGLLAWGMIRFQVRLPLRQFFIITSTIMVALSITLSGKFIHELIEAGLIKATPVSFVPDIDFLGVYSTAETLALQVFLLVFSLWLSRRLGRTSSSA